MNLLYYMYMHICMLCTLKDACRQVEFQLNYLNTLFIGKEQGPYKDNNEKLTYNI